MGAESRASVRAILAKRYTHVRISLVNNLGDLEALVARQPDLVFLGMKFIPHDPRLGQDDSRKIWLTHYLDEHDIAYTGSNHLAHELELNKDQAKQRVLDMGLKTSPFYVIQRQQPPSMDMPFSYPVFIKPTNRGGGLGIDSDSVAHNFAQLVSKVRSITELNSDSLVEEYLPGREFSVAILKDAPSGRFWTMPIELIAPLDASGARILSEKVKLADTETHRMVANEAVKSQINALAISVFQAIGARDYGRIDIRLDRHGVPQFLEANLLPSLINNFGNFPKACLLNIGLDYESMILRITRLGLARTTHAPEPVVTPLALHSLIVPMNETALEPVG